MMLKANTCFRLDRPVAVTARNLAYFRGMPDGMEPWRKIVFCIEDTLLLIGGIEVLIFHCRISRKCYCNREMRTTAIWMVTISATLGCFAFVRAFVFAFAAIRLFSFRCSFVFAGWSFLFAAWVFTFFMRFPAGRCHGGGQKETQRNQENQYRKLFLHIQNPRYEIIAIQDSTLGK